MATELKGRVFLAGASGAIGRRLCRLLVDDGWFVVGSTRSPGKTEMLRDLGVEPAVVDVFDEALLLETVRRARPDIVVHQLTDLPQVPDPAQLAGALPRNARLRETGTRHLIAAAVAAGAKRMVAQSIAFACAPGPKPASDDAPLNVDDPVWGATARGVASLEQQVLNAPFPGIVLRYGMLYGPGTWSDQPQEGGPVHVDAAADAARRALICGDAGIYNIAEEDGAVSSAKAASVLGWNPGFRLTER